MTNLQNYIKKGLLKKQRPNFEQIKNQLYRAEKDLKTFNKIIETDPEWASAIAYQSMLRMGRALLFAHGYLPVDGQQHKTVVEVTGRLLGSKFNTTIKQFDRLRKNRNVFFYDSVDSGNRTEARKAIKTAKILFQEIDLRIITLNPQQPIKIDDLINIL